MSRRDGGAAAVLDFSGTLSLGAVEFGRPQNLERALQDSGLAGLGLDPMLFWSEVINPAWQEGSTTPRGYRELLGEGLCRLARSRGEIPDEEAIRAAAGRFTAAYLACSRIEPEWGPLLRRLARRGVVVVATDHYAEATAHIIGELARLGTAAAALQARGAPVLVANSADLGAHKESPSFWAALRPLLERAAPASLLLVDDFGHNEQAGDSYARPDRVAARQAQIVAAIEAACSAPVRVFPFLLHRREEYATLVKAAGSFLAGS